MKTLLAHRRKKKSRYIQRWKKRTIKRKPYQQCARRLREPRKTKHQHQAAPENRSISWEVHQDMRDFFFKRLVPPVAVVEVIAFIAGLALDNWMGFFTVTFALSMGLAAVWPVRP